MREFSLLALDLVLLWRRETTVVCMFDACTLCGIRHAPKPEEKVPVELAWAATTLFGPIKIGWYVEHQREGEPLGDEDADGRDEAPEEEESEMQPCHDQLKGKVRS